MSTVQAIILPTQQELTQALDDRRVGLVLEALANGEKALSAATEINDMLTLHDRAKAIEYLSRTVHLSRDVQNKAAELTIKAERKLGIYLSQMPKNTGARGNPEGRGAEYADDTTPTYEELGIDYRSASRWQAMARLPEAKLTEFFNEVNEAGRELTCGGVYQYAKNWRQKHAIGNTPPSAREHLGLEQATPIYKGELTVTNFLQIAKILRELIRSDGEVRINIEQLR